MPQHTDKFAYESFQDCQTVVNYLRALADGIEAGRLRLACEDVDTTLEPHGLLRLRVRATRGNYRTRLGIRLSWREQERSVPRTTPLQIDSAPPEKPAEG